MTIQWNFRSDSTHPPDRVSVISLVFTASFYYTFCLHPNEGQLHIPSHALDYLLCGDRVVFVYSFKDIGTIFDLAALYRKSIF